jgi:hypothetical protein
MLSSENIFSACTARGSTSTSSCGLEFDGDEPQLHNIIYFELVLELKLAWLDKLGFL